jgi:hypothetical protein
MIDPGDEPPFLMKEQGMGGNQQECSFEEA